MLGHSTLAGPTTWNGLAPPSRILPRYLMTSCVLPPGPTPLRAHSHHLAEVNLGMNLLTETFTFPSLWLYSSMGLVCCPARPAAKVPTRVLWPYLASASCSDPHPCQRDLKGSCSFVVVPEQFNAAQSPWSAQLPPQEWLIFLSKPSMLVTEIS